MAPMKASLGILALVLGLVIAPGARGAGGFGSPVVVTGLDTGEPKAPAPRAPGAMTRPSASARVDRLVFMEGHG